ncbi:hypothetical protein SPRG_01779 [Saprolegnia parasitica CBS 223.65]|uniref:Ubiquitin-like domain-containing protein n=1 Tax=Saprolegnia parasitica (strain CBS 223.65) TaxID=695850 RepID=A0A067CT62_SAPPC|nr:hypothetical protein SPRG_01779 [Saprolegnia parasitica CBS 223.65]KDO33899.1 hypothetical protein SPRG_01779 [Saprolegnia parasitica CBS 223.65]|eukprot:XP_012195535.1 hypothetical protein SPRG_01779 [Saprolegnia parasitica CBS 223.65]
MDLAPTEDWEIVDELSTERRLAPTLPAEATTTQVGLPLLPAEVMTSTLPAAKGPVEPSVQEESTSKVKAAMEFDANAKAKAATATSTKVPVVPKPVVDDADLTPIRVRVGERIDAHQFRADETVDAFVAMAFPGEHKDGKRIRLIFKGAYMLPEKSMATYRLSRNDVIHAIITEPVRDDVPTDAGSTLDVVGFGLRASDVLLLLTGFIVLTMWVWYSNYPQHFSSLSFTTLLALSGFHAYCVYSALLVHQELGR